MASPYSGQEMMSFDDDKTKPTSQQVEKQEQPQQPKIPDDSSNVIGLFEKVVQSPNNIDTLWSFVKGYLTYLESKTDMVRPFFDNQGDNLMTTIKKSSIQNVPWGIYNCFLTISNIGSTIAQKQDLDDKDHYYIMYVMLSFGEDSPVYQFTQLLQTIQTQDDDTKKLYQQLDSKFMDSFKKYEKSSKKVSPRSTSGFLNKSITIAGKEVSYKVLLIVVVIILLLLGMGGGYYFYSKGSRSSTYVPKSVGPRQGPGSDTSSIMS